MHWAAMILDVSDSDGQKASEQKASILSQMRGNGTSTTERRMLGGKVVALERLQATREGLTAVAYFAALEGSAGTRILFCGGPERAHDQCLSALDVLASLPWRGGVPPGASQAAESIALEGRSVTVPEGCKADVVGPDEWEVRCGKAFYVHWGYRALQSLAEETLSHAEEELSIASPRSVACAVNRMPTTCRLATLTDSKGNSATYRGAIVERGSHSYLVAFCFAPGNGEGLPCSIAFGR